MAFSADCTLTNADWLRAVTGPLPTAEKSAGPLLTKSIKRVKNVPTPVVPGVVQAKAGLKTAMQKVYDRILTRGATIRSARQTKGITVDQATMDAIITEYTMNEYDESDVAEAVYEAMLASYEASYRANMARVGKPVAANWAPTDATAKDIEDQATQVAAGIATTYNDALNTYIDLADGTDTVTDDDMEWNSELTQFVQESAGYRSELIADVQSRNGADLGVDQAVDDIVTLDSADSTAVICVLPSETGCDECSAWAGQTVMLADADSLPPFPIHPNCEHGKHLMPSDSLE